MNSLVTYYRNRAQEYRRLLRRAVRAPHIETIHELRLVIKKMRAMYSLAASHDPRFDFDLHFASIAKIFKASGKLRDSDITRKCLLEMMPEDKTAKKLSALLEKKRNEHAGSLKSFAKIIISKKKRYDNDVLRFLEE